MRQIHSAAAATFVVLAATSATAAPVFMKFEGVDVPAGKGEIEVLSYSWGATRAGGKMHMEDISAAPTSKDGAKGGNVEFEWKVEEGESAPPPPGGVRVAAGDVDGDGRAAPAKTVKSPRDAASGLPTGKRQHKPVTFTKPLDKGSVWVRVATPWAGCRVGARYPSLALSDGAKRYLLQDVVVSSCGGSSAADDRPTEEVAFYYNKVAFN